MARKIHNPKKVSSTSAPAVAAKGARTYDVGTAFHEERDGRFTPSKSPHVPVFSIASSVAGACAISFEGAVATYERYRETETLAFIAAQTSE